MASELKLSGIEFMTRGYRERLLHFDVLLFCCRVRDPAIHISQNDPYNYLLLGRLAGSRRSGKFRLLVAHTYKYNIYNIRTRDVIHRS